MAVQLDLDAVRDAVESFVLDAAEALVAGGRIGEITGVGGGAIATVDGTTVWVGIVDGAFTAECDCTEAAHGQTAAHGADDEELCAHAVALTIAAIGAGFAWSSVATPPSQAAVDPSNHRA